MRNHENKSESVKVRVTKTELHCIQQIAQNRPDTVSNVIRDAMFNQQSDFCSSIKNELIKQRIFNLIQHTSMPKASRENLIKELNQP